MGVAYQRGMVLYSQRRYRMAADEFRRELSQNPKSALSMSMLALSLTYDKGGEEGLPEAQAAIAADPERAFCHYALSCTIIGTKTTSWSALQQRLAQQVWSGFASYTRKIKRARPPAMEAVRLEPHNPDYLGLVSAIELDLGSTRQALEWADRGLAARPDHVRCANLRAKALTRMGHIQEARQTLTRALSVDPENAATHATSGWTLLKAGRRQQAVEHFTESVRLNPEDAQARRGLSLAKTGKKAGGIGILFAILWAVSRLASLPQSGTNQPNANLPLAPLDFAPYTVPQTDPMNRPGPGNPPQGHPQPFPPGLPQPYRPPAAPSPWSPPGAAPAPSPGRR